MSLVGMSISFILIWWSVFFVTLPFGLKHGDQQSGNQIGAPTKKHLKEKLILTTLITIIIWSIIWITLTFFVETNYV